MFLRFAKLPNIDNPDFIMPLPPLEQALMIKKLMQEAKDRNLSENLRRSYFYVKRNAEEELQNDIDF